MPRLLLVAYYFPPATGGGVARALSFARHLPAHGWQVTVLCADPRSAPLRDETRAPALPGGVERIEVGMPGLLRAWRRSVIGSGPARPSALYRLVRGVSSWAFVPDSFAPWRSRAVKAARKRMARGGFDVVLTTSPPDTVHLVGLDLAATPGHVPWVADFRDPWVGLTYRTPPSPWHASHQRQMRDAVLANADIVLATTRASGDELAATGAGDRVRLLPNGWEDDGPAPESARVVPNGGLRLVYTGTLWDVPSTRHFFPALRSALGKAGEGDPRIRLAVAGAHESADLALVRSHGLEDAVRFLGQIPYAESRRLQSEADALLLLQVHGRGYAVAVPGKLYEYIASMRPIVAVLEEGEAADLVRAAGGWVVSPVDRAGMRKAMERLIAGERPAGDTPQRRQLAEEFRRDRLAAQLATILDSLVEEHEREQARAQAREQLRERRSR